MSNTNRYNNWFNTEVGYQVVSKKYMHEGEQEFNDFRKRVASIFTTIELQDQMGAAIRDADFFPGGRSLYAAGSKGKFKASMSNCYIMPMPEDNIESIFEVAKKTARIFSYGGGAGINISKLRPNGARVTNAARTSTGSVSFMEIFDSVGNVIGANNRRAALILGLNCDHPDIEEFLEIKKNNDKIQSANISILFNDEFMKAVETDNEYELYFKVESTGEEIRKRINARDFFMKFAEAQWDYAEPGALFIDKIRSYNLLSAYPEEEYKIDISNPCAEYLGNAYNSCNLGSINLYNMVENPFTEDARINYTKLQEAVELGVKALDEILDYGYDMQPLEENKKCLNDWRAIGLGVFGLADMLVALGVQYGSERSVRIVQDLMEEIMILALNTSSKLAKEKGTFSKYNWEYVKESPFIKGYVGTTLYDKIKKYGLRNGSLLSIAPTGSISTMCGISGGVEPLFAISYERTTHALEKTGKKFKVFAKSVEHLLKAKGLNPDNYTDEQIKEMFPYVVASHDIDPLDRVKVQAAMQKFVDNAISSTVNLKNEATIEDVFNVYMEAWKQGCKGITVFRNGCARNAILTTGKEEKKESDIVKFNSIEPVKRGNLKRVDGSTIVGHTACVKNLYTTVNVIDENVFEVFTNVSSGCKSNINTITRLVSLALRSGVKVEEVVSELKANVCPACSILKQQGNKDVSGSCGGCIAEAIEAVYNNVPIKIEMATREAKKIDNGLLACPKCGENTLRPEGKCFNCSACGFSKCE